LLFEKPASVSIVKGKQRFFGGREESLFLFQNLSMINIELINPQDLIIA